MLTRSWGKAVASRLHVEEGLEHTVHQELVAQDAVQIKQIKDQLAGGRIVNLVGEGQLDVKLREAGEMEPGAFVASVKLVEQTVKTEQALVSVLRSKVHAVIVIPQRAQSFIDVTIGLVV